MPKSRTTLAQLVKDTRTQRGLSQAELAKRVGVSRGAISQIELGDTQEPTLLVVRGLAGAFGLSLEEVVEVALGLPSTKAERAEPQSAVADAILRDRDLTDEWRDAVWAVYLRAKEHAQRRRGALIPARRTLDRFVERSA